MEIRLFLATWLSPERREDVTEIVNRLRPNSTGIKWTTPEQMHFTLKFLGEQPAALPEKLEPLLAQLAGETSKFSLGLGPGGVFPEKGDPRILWLGLAAGADRLKSLAEKIEAACFELGLPKEEKPFKPHLTIGRVKNHPARFERALLEQGVPGEMEVKSFSLVESRLGPFGPSYSMIKEYFLKPSD